MSVLWLLLGLLVLTGECAPFPQMTLEMGKINMGIQWCFWYLKLQWKKKGSFFPQAVQQILGLVTAIHSLFPDASQKEGVLQNEGWAYSSPAWGQTLNLFKKKKTIPLNNAHCSSIKILSPKVLTEFINRPYISTEGLRWFTTVKLM